MLVCLTQATDQMARVADFLGWADPPTRACPALPCPPCPPLQVEALQETLQRLEKADDVLLRLTEDKAALQLQLRDAQAAAEGARAAAEERGRRAAEAEGTCLELQRQLDAALEQHDVAHAAVEGAADHLQQLTGSHEGLERQLAQASGELQAAQQELAQRTQLAARLEQAAMALDAELRQALHQRDSTYAQLQEAQRQLGAAQQEAAAQHHLGGELQQRLAAATAAQEALAAERQGLAEENASLKENLQVCVGGGGWGGGGGGGALT